MRWNFLWTIKAPLRSFITLYFSRHPPEGTASLAVLPLFHVYYVNQRLTYSKCVTAEPLSGRTIGQEVGRWLIPCRNYTRLKNQQDPKRLFIIRQNHESASMLGDGNNTNNGKGGHDFSLIFRQALWQGGSCISVLLVSDRPPTFDPNNTVTVSRIFYVTEMYAVRPHLHNQIASVVMYLYLFDTPLINSLWEKCQTSHLF